MTTHVAGLTLCAALAVSVGCERSPRPEGGVRPSSERGAPSAAPAEAEFDVGALSDDELAERIARLNASILPPAGTALSSVGLVYGQPQVVPALPKGAKGSAADYPMHVHELLPPTGRAEFRAVLLVTCRDASVSRARINHSCVAKGRVAGARSVDVQRELRVEQERVLRDLLAIQEKFGARLAAAPWTR